MSSSANNEPLTHRDGQWWISAAEYERRRIQECQRLHDLVGGMQFSQWRYSSIYRMIVIKMDEPYLALWFVANSQIQSTGGKHRIRLTLYAIDTQDVTNVLVRRLSLTSKANGQLDLDEARKVLQNFNETLDSYEQADLRQLRRLCAQLTYANRS